MTESTPGTTAEENPAQPTADQPEATADTTATTEPGAAAATDDVTSTTSDDAAATATGDDEAPEGDDAASSGEGEEDDGDEDDEDTGLETEPHEFTPSDPALCSVCGLTAEEHGTTGNGDDADATPVQDDDAAPDAEARFSEAVAATADDGGVDTGEG